MPTLTSPDADAPTGGLWPTPAQQLALRIALGAADEARAAFDEWLRCVDFERDFDRGTYRLLPLMYDRLRHHGIGHPILQRLKGIYRRTWYENTNLFERTRPVLEALRAAGIPVLLIKGAPLVARYYRNVALRPMADIDIVVPAARARDALRIAERFPYDRQGFPSDDWLRFHHARSFESANHGEVDLHWHVLPYCIGPDDDAAFWQSAVPFAFAGVDCLSLDPTRMLFHTVVHGLRWNEESPIRWIVDAMWILRAAEAEGGIDWAAFVAQGLSMQLSQRLGLALAYLTAEFDAPVPPEVLGRLQREPPSRLERLEHAIVLRDATHLEGSPLGVLRISFCQYARLARHERPLAFAIGFTHYMRFCLNLRGRSEMVGFVARGLLRRLRRRAGPTSNPAAGNAAADRGAVR